jgi:hypothetical protein
MRNLALTIITFGIITMFNKFIYANPEDLSCFKKSYHEAQEQFLSLAKEFISANSKNQMGVENISGVSIDFLYMINDSKAPLVIIQSGMHGVEGHVGSAIQCYLLKSFKKSPIKHLNFLFIHGINADGFSRNRRVNQNNVDLNRNLFDNPSGYLTVNDGYIVLKDYLNPKEPLDLGVLSKIKFYLSTAYHIIKHSKDTLKRTLLRGQYAFPEGIYFGGQKMEPQIMALTNLWNHFGSLHERLLLIDLHTGYGKRGQLHLLSNSSESEQSKSLQNLFSPTLIDFGDSSEFYQTTGDNVSGFVKHFSAKKAIGVAFEYGTLDSQTLTGSIDSLYRLIIENQGHQFGYADANSEQSAKTLFVEMFYPTDSAWRQNALEQTQKEFSKVLERLR